jgi:protease YdgD
MVGKLLRCLLLCASFSFVLSGVATASAIATLDGHREDVDESRYPWAAIGKLYNETGSSCSGVAIASDKILTAAHCLFNFRSQRFVPADALHFLLGYRSGRYAVHARVASYEIGPGFDPLQYDRTSDADWAILTITENLPAGISPLRLSRNIEPSGTKAVIAGYPQDRAFAMTADSNCELREEIDDGRLFLHTCRGIGGYSGAPILVSAGGNEVQIAGIQIAKFRSSGNETEKMLAVTALAIRHQGWHDTPDVQPASDAVSLDAKCDIVGGEIAALSPLGFGLPAEVEKTGPAPEVQKTVPPENQFIAILSLAALPFSWRLYRTASNLPPAWGGIPASPILPWMWPVTPEGVTLAGSDLWFPPD